VLYNNQKQREYVVLFQYKTKKLYALGRPGNPGSLKIPFDEKEATISDIKMDGTVAPRLHQFFGQHSEISEAEKETWSAIFKMLHDIFETLCQYLR
jgi:hypothetical protein